MHTPTFSLKVQYKSFNFDFLEDILAFSRQLGMGGQRTELEKYHYKVFNLYLNSSKKE